MPDVQSKPDEVHGRGPEDDGSGGKLASVSGEELVQPEDLTCGATSKMMTENGTLMVRCTMDKKAGHVHYDEIFSKEWH